MKVSDSVSYSLPSLSLHTCAELIKKCYTHRPPMSRPFLSERRALETAGSIHEVGMHALAKNLDSELTVVK
jgi:hypothetical protein